MITFLDIVHICAALVLQMYVPEFPLTDALATMREQDKEAAASLSKSPPQDFTGLFWKNS